MVNRKKCTKNGFTRTQRGKRGRRWERVMAWELLDEMIGEDRGEQSLWSVIRTVVGCTENCFYILT